MCFYENSHNDGLMNDDLEASKAKQKTTAAQMKEMKTPQNTSNIILYHFQMIKENNEILSDQTPAQMFTLIFLFLIKSK